MKEQGFSLLEVLIVSVVVSILAILGIRGIGQGHQKESLLKAGNQIVDLLRKAQSDAKLFGEYRGICFKNNVSTQNHFASMYKPVIAGGSILPSNNDCSDGAENNTGPTVSFGNSIKFCLNCDSKVNLNQSIFFDKDGMTSEHTGLRTVYEICIINMDLPAGTRAREVEVGINGDIQLLPQTAQGSYAGVVANQGNCI